MLVTAKSALVAVKAAAVVGACTAPPGMQAQMDTVGAWVKWGVYSLLGVSGLVCIGAILIGRIFSHPRASQHGSLGLAVVVLAGVLLVVFPGMLTAITGSCS